MENQRLLLTFIDFHDGRRRVKPKTPCWVHLTPFTSMGRHFESVRLILGSRDSMLGPCDAILSPWDAILCPWDAILSSCNAMKSWDIRWWDANLGSWDAILGPRSLIQCRDLNAKNGWIINISGFHWVRVFVEWSCSILLKRRDLLPLSHNRALLEITQVHIRETTWE